MERVLIENYCQNPNLFIVQLQICKKTLFHSKWKCINKKEYIINDKTILGELLARWVIKNCELKIHNNSVLSNEKLSNLIRNQELKTKLSEPEFLEL